MPFETKPPRKINIFYCYAREDRKARVTLANHLSNLRWQGYIDDWYDGEISPGDEWEEEIATHLENADIILLLITSNFMAS
jgi:TIR domain